MPLARYVIRNEYSLADPEVYRRVEKDDPESLLEGIAMAGLIGILRQLGDLAEFAAELFHDLHEEIMATSSRGHDLVNRVQQLEADLPSIEKNLLSRTNNLNFTYTTGSDWRSSSRNEHKNLLTRTELPHFIMDSSEECRAPPRLFLLDKFDVAGAGACLKRYSDPSFFRLNLSCSGTLETDHVEREKRTCRVKKKGLRQRNGQTLQPLLDSGMDNVSLIADVNNGKPEKIPMHGVKLKMRQMNGCPTKKPGRTYMEQILERAIGEDKKLLSVNPFSITNPLHDPSFSEIQEKSREGSANISLHIEGAKTQSPKKLKDAFVLPSNESVCDPIVTIPEKSAEGTLDIKGVVPINDVKQDHVYVYGGTKLEMTTEGEMSDDFVSELETYMDALATIESELETDSDCRTKNEVELFVVNLRDNDSDTNVDKLQQPSESYDSRVENSPASCDSNDSLGKEKLNFLVTDAFDHMKLPTVAKVLPLDDSLENTYSLLDSGNLIKLKDVNPAPSCDNAHAEATEGAPSSVNGVLVRSSTNEGFSAVEENDKTISVMFPESTEQQSVGFPVPNARSSVLHISQEASCTSLILGEELSCQKGGPRTGEVQASPAVILLESSDHGKSLESPTSHVIDEVHLNDPNSTEMSREISCAYLVKAASTLPRLHERPFLDKVLTPANATFPKSKSVDRLFYDVTADVHFELSSSQMSGEACSAPSMPDVASKLLCPSEVSTVNEVQTSSVILFSESSIQYKPLETAISDVTVSTCFDDSSSHEVPGDASCVSSMLDIAPSIPYSLKRSTASKAETPVSVMLLGDIGEYKPVECLISDVIIQGHLEGASTLQESQKASCASSVFATTSALPCPHEGIGLDPVQTSFSQDSEIFLDSEEGFVLDPLRVAVPNDMPDIHHQPNAANFRDEIRIQFPDKVISANDIANGSGDFLLMSREGMEQCEASIATNNDILSSLIPIYLPSFHPDDLGAETHNIAPGNENLESVVSVNVVEGENLLTESEYAGTTFIAPHSRRSCPGSPTSVLPPKDSESKEFMEPGILSPVAHCVLTQNHELMPNRSSNETSERKYIDDHQFSNLVTEESVSGGLPSKAVVYEMENLSEEVHRESETLKGPSVSNRIFENFTSDHADIMEGVPDYVDIEPVRVVTRIVEANAEIEDKHIPDEQLPPKIVALDVSPPTETTSGSILLNMASSIGAPPRSDLSSHSLLDCDRPSTGDGSTGILCDSGRLDVKAGHPPCEALPHLHPCALAEPSSMSIGDSKNSSAVHELPSDDTVPNITVRTEVPKTMATTQSHDGRPGKSGLHSAEMSSGGATLQNITLGMILYQQKFDTSRSSEIDMSDSQICGLGPAAISVTSESVDQEDIEPGLCSNIEFIEYPLPCMSAQGEYMGDVLEDPVSNDFGETVVESTSALQKELDLDKPKRHAEQSMILEVPFTVSRELQGHFTCAYHCNQQKADDLQISVCDNHYSPAHQDLCSERLAHQLQCDISEGHSTSIRTLDDLDSIECINPDITAGFSFHLRLSENGESEVLNIPAISESDLDLSHKSSVQSCEVIIMPSISTSMPSSIPDLRRTENLKESGIMASYNILEDYTGNSYNHSVTCIASVAAVSHGFPQLSEPFHPTQDASSISGPLSLPSDVAVLASSAFHSHCALDHSEIDQVQSHEKEFVHDMSQIHPATSISNPSVLSHLQAVTDVMPPLPLPPMEWIMGKPHPNFSPLPQIAPYQPTFTPNTTATEAAWSNGALPWKSRSVYRRTKDRLIEAVASHDKSTLRKVTDWDQVEIKPKPEERDVLMEQIRAKSFSLKPIYAPRPAIHAPATNIKVAAILEKAKAIRQAYTGTGSDDDDADRWSDT